MNHHHRLAPKYGDSNIVLSIYYSEFWKFFFTGNKNAWWILFKSFGNLAREMMLFPVRSFLRIRHGKHSTGWIIFFLSASMLVAYNSNFLIPVFAPITAFFVWLLPFFMDSATMENLIFEQVHSSFMTKFNCGFFLVGLAQIIALKYFKLYDEQDPAKRGDSILHLGLSQIFKDQAPISETFIQTYIEPAILLCLSAFFWWGYYDLVPCIYFLSTGIFLFIQEILDVMKRDTLPS